jgi:hypothetical protein
MDHFADANIYQTWAYGAVRRGEGNLSHVTLRRDGEVVAMAQLALAGPHKLGIGVAQLRWGPLWEKKSGIPDQRVLDQMAVAMREEYAVRRQLYLQVLPRAWMGTDRAAAFQTAFSQYDTRAFRPGESYRTLELDLSPALDVVRKGLDRKWRNHLNRSERNGLTIREGDSEADFAIFIEMYEEMRLRKRYTPSSDIREFRRIQRILPHQQRMCVLICEQEGVPVAGLVGTGMGDSGIYLFGATTDQGMKTQGAYLLQWHMIQWLKRRGATRYDLGGINPETNPGVYHFKAGLSGRDVLYLTPFVSCDHIASRHFFTAGSAVNARVRTAINRFLRRGP